MSDEVEMRDPEAVEEAGRQYGQNALTEEELNEKYPNRPHNHSKTLAFHDLFMILFNPLDDNRRRPTGPTTARKKTGRYGPSNLAPHEARRSIIERFISRWRKEVGNDIYPAFRLVLPDKDRDRPMYGLKEKAIGKLLVRILRIDKDSEDGYNLLNWKLPGQKTISTMAGDFAGRCYEIISKRPIRTTVGDMTIAEVNEKLDQLSIASKEEDQLPIFERFYRRMNPEEMLWLVRIILRQTKIGASEKTIFDVWHPDAESLFNVSSSLRRVCWELHDPSVRLDGEDRGIRLMQCFQPQLAQFQIHSFERIATKMKPTEADDSFWIEEKLDGERMQLHMIEDGGIAGGKRLGFWSRKAKEYTYLYGEGFQDEDSALTRHIKNAFDDGVRNIVLDGEMITWDLEQDAIVPFGTLKAAAKSEQRNPFSSGQRPLYRVFDCLYLNDMPLTSYTLRDRRKALESAISPIHRRLEVHTYTEAHKAEQIEPMLRQVVAEASEGLVVKNPRSMYRLNERNDDWIKVKPEYMTEFGEDLDCIVLGGYYGSGHRGGRLSSFLCGLRVDQHQVDRGYNPQLCFSFFKVGGGFTAADYASIRHHTGDKWQQWDPKKPPSEYIELGGGVEKQYERPDVWLKPEDSVVFSVKAASVNTTDQFRMGLTLRFPRFKALRTDKDWRSALSIQGFIDLKNNAERERRDKEFRVDSERKKRPRITRKKPLVITGNDEVLKTPYAGPTTKVFEGLTFFVISESVKPEKKSKVELEQLIKANGGRVVQQETAAEHVICVADRKLVRVASMIKRANRSIVRPSWLFDCIKQTEIDVGRPSLLLPMEPNHMLFIAAEDEGHIRSNVDVFGDSFARDVTADELKAIFGDMKLESYTRFEPSKLLQQLRDHGVELNDLPGWMFRGLTVYVSSLADSSHIHADVDGSPISFELLDLSLDLISQKVLSSGGRLSDNLHDTDITHVVIRKNCAQLTQIRAMLSRRPRVPRIVTAEWVQESWKENTLLAEENFVPI